MKNIILLFLAMIKGNGLGQLASDRSANSKKRKIKSAGSVIMLALAGIYMGGIGVIYVVQGHKLLSSLGLQTLIPGITVSLLAFLSFFFGLFYAMSIFYFSSDTEKLLPLPVTPGQMIMSKFFVTLVYEYLIILVLLAPAMITYGISEKTNLMYYIYMFITLILLPVMPLVLACIVIMIIMRFAPVVRNKDIFTLVASIFAILTGFGIGFGMQRIFSGSDTGNLENLLAESAVSITKISSSVFPVTYFANYSLVKPYGLDSMLMISVFIAITFISFFILYLFGNILYLKGVLSINASGSKGKKLSEKEFSNSIHSANVFITYLKKELKLLFRTPIFFMNNVLMNFLMPVIILVPILFNSGSDGFSIADMRILIATEFLNPGTGNSKILLLVFFAIITFICGTNGITESAISREGKSAYFMKIIPMSYTKQIWVKITSGLILSTIASLLMLVTLSLIILPPPSLLFAAIAVIPGAVLFPNVSGILFDLYNPKIKWDNEQKAVKQNMNVLYGILLSTLLIVMVSIPVLVFDFSIVAASILIIVLPIVFSIAASVFVNKKASNLMLELTP